MLKEECDKIYNGRCSCLSGIKTPVGQEHWCSTKTDPVRVIDTYHLPPNTTMFYMASHTINLQSRGFMDQIKQNEKCTVEYSSQDNDDGSKITIIDMSWNLESDFLPSWVWMIESGYNAQRDAYNKKHGITFSKQVITKTEEFTITEGLLNTNTANAPYHIDLQAQTV